MLERTPRLWIACLSTAVLIAACGNTERAGGDGDGLMGAAAGGSATGSVVDPGPAGSAQAGQSGAASVGSGGAAVPGGAAASGEPSAADPNDPDAIPLVEPVEVVDVDAIAAEVPSVSIEIGAAEQASLEADLWGAEDVPGSFVGEDGVRYEMAELNYRGAYALQNLTSSEQGYRNWKVKFSKEQDYLGRREWNFNSEPHLRQKLAYDLMKFAGVRVPAAQHVLLNVNDEDFGPYLRYADPDSKGWLKDAFGSAAGDLFKAAYDLPGEDKYFALLTVLGDTDADYFLHYNKKLNNNDAAAEDYSSLRSFIEGLNNTPDAELPAWFEDNFDVERFISYLVVGNFMCNWDSYPQRPKNYWLYQSPVTHKWSYIPWDMDGTFQSFPGFNYAMRTDASIFNEFDEYDNMSGGGFGGGPESGEGEERPLVRRLMGIPSYRDAYVARYRELLGGILAEGYLLDRISRLEALVRPVVRGDQLESFEEQTADMRDFVGARSAALAAELSTL